MMAGSKVIAGNWKMHMNPEETREFLRGFSLPSSGGRMAVQVLLFPPSVSLSAAVDACAHRDDVALGVQNVHWEDSGAYTGEISVPMAVVAGATHTLIGHSERRHLFGETNQEVGMKVSAALEGGLVPVVCVGETLEEREGGRLEDVLLEQMEAFLLVLQAHPGARIMVAYEPVWAIGTGKTATPEDASQAHAFLRGRLVSALGPERAREIPILYGGSVKPANAAELLNAAEVDGVLVGGASLDPVSFRAIAEAAPQ